tara:strand:- start:113 stop:367 length:255 start_codon:yes stop_codon:yes gene_type:complete
MATTKVNESYDAGQFLTASLTHFTVTHTTAVVMKDLVETASTRATVVILGDAGGRIAVENNGAWTAATLQTALGTGYTVADFDY